MKFIDCYRLYKNVETYEELLSIRNRGEFPLDISDCETIINGLSKIVTLEGIVVGESSVVLGRRGERAGIVWFKSNIEIHIENILTTPEKVIKIGDSWNQKENLKTIVKMFEEKFNDVLDYIKLKEKFNRDNDDFEVLVNGMFPHISKEDVENIIHYGMQPFSIYKIHTLSNSMEAVESLYKAASKTFDLPNFSDLRDNNLKALEQFVIHSENISDRTKGCSVLLPLDRENVFTMITATSRREVTVDLSKQEMFIDFDFSTYAANRILSDLEERNCKLKIDYFYNGFRFSEVVTMKNIQKDIKLKV